MDRKRFRPYNTFGYVARLHRAIQQSRILRLISAYFLGLLFAILTATAVYANLAITTTTTPSDLQTALQGNNVTVSNVTVNQGTTAGQIGTFVGGLTGGAGPVIGIDDGVVMVTGTASSALGPNNNSRISTGNETGPTDTNLATVDSGNQFDTAILNFSVVPSGNFMALDFVFGSDEYNEYVCTRFNDAMGIFVSGPGITGTANIARLSTNTTPISVNQINRGVAGAASSGGNVAPCNLTNGAFYVKNIGDSTVENGALGSATSSAFTNLQYDGFTIPLTAQVQVTPGSTYTVKVVIADIGDARWDSGVFIDGIRSFNLDLGDAPDSYGTRPIDQTIQIPGPARHSTGQDIYLGATAPDAENTVTPATSPNAANADDLNGTDDEDAFSGDLTFAPGITTHSLNNIPVRNGTGSTAKLMGWIDFNKDGDFLDAGELATINVAPNQTTANLSWSGFTAPTVGTSYARFRITTDPNIANSPTPLGLAGNGEVEDYRVSIAAAIDRSDAPISGIAPIGTGTNNYGEATHTIVNGIKLGAAIDSDANSIASADASGDGIDDDGVTIPTLVRGQNATITTTVTGAGGYLQGWLDWNGNGAFDAGEQIATNIQDNGTSDTNSAVGTISFNVTVPSTAIITAPTFSRFRWSTTQNLTSTVAATNGEVEDYQLSIVGNPNVLLVKRITAINGGTSTVGGDNLGGYIVETANDSNTKWPTPVNTFLLGGTDGGSVKPNDALEYTIYFLSAGEAPANKVTFCDRVPDNVTFIPTAFNGITHDTSGLSTAERGIAVNLSGTLKSYTNIADGDFARYYPPDPTQDLPDSCKKLPTDLPPKNTNGAIIINLGDLPNATVPGEAGSYGFVRFQGRVK